MKTINISLPEKLKSQAEDLIKNGYFASFSDLVRDSLRRSINLNKYDLWADEAKKELKSGKAKVLKSAKDIDEYMKDL
jgi:Arc/MetJ-type ribon-helix-helix transcriptional regulator